MVLKWTQATLFFRQHAHRQHKFAFVNIYIDNNNFCSAIHTYISEYDLDGLSRRPLVHIAPDCVLFACSMSGMAIPAKLFANRGHRRSIFLLYIYIYVCGSCSCSRKCIILLYTIQWMRCMGIESPIIFYICTICTHLHWTNGRARVSLLFSFNISYIYMVVDIYKAIFGTNFAAIFENYLSNTAIIPYRNHISISRLIDIFYVFFGISETLVDCMPFSAENFSACGMHSYSGTSHRWCWCWCWWWWSAGKPACHIVIFISTKLTAK